MLGGLKKAGRERQEANRWTDRGGTPWRRYDPHSIFIVNEGGRRVRQAGRQEGRGQGQEQGQDTAIVGVKNMHSSSGCAMTKRTVG